jgi:hypothetical protein
MPSPEHPEARLLRKGTRRDHCHTSSHSPRQRRHTTSQTDHSINSSASIACHGPSLDNASHLRRLFENRRSTLTLQTKGTGAASGDRPVPQGNNVNGHGRGKTTTRTLIKLRTATSDVALNGRWWWSPRTCGCVGVKGTGCSDSCCMGYQNDVVRADCCCWMLDRGQGRCKGFR